MPLDMAFSPDSSDTYPLLRHFFSSNNDNFVFEGVSYNWLIAQPKGTIVLDPTVSLSDNTEDTYIANGNATNYGSDQKLHVGRQMTNTDWKRMLLKFDLSAIPQDAAILNAALKLRYYGRNGPNLTSRTIDCHKMLVDWQEDEATWFERKTAVSWTSNGVNLGADAAATPEGSQVWFSNPVWIAYNLLSAVQGWHANPQTNYGVYYRVGWHYLPIF